MEKRSFYYYYKAETCIRLEFISQVKITFYFSIIKTVLAT